MLYYIIEKVHVVNGSVVHTPVGYTVNIEHKTTLNTAFENGMSAWLINNKEDLESGILHPSVYFDTNSDFHYVTGSVTYIDESGLIEIKDLNDL